MTAVGRSRHAGDGAAPSTTLAGDRETDHYWLVTYGSVTVGWDHDDRTQLRRRPRDIGKPRMRGWLHTYAFFVAAVCGIVLCSLAATRPGARR